MLTKTQEMDGLWAEQTAQFGAKDASVAKLFRDGNYAMFIHWELYSNLAGLVSQLRSPSRPGYCAASWGEFKRQASKLENHKSLRDSRNYLKHFQPTEVVITCARNDGSQDIRKTGARLQTNCHRSG